MPARHHLHRPSSTTRAVARWLAAGTVATAPWLVAQAAPLPPLGGRSLAVVTTDRICNGNANPNGTLIGCVVTSDAAVSALGLMDAFGAQGAGSITATPHGADLRALARAVVVRGGQIGDPVGVTVVQFDMFTVQGPKATVPLSVVMDLNAEITLAGPAPIVTGTMAGQFGMRAGASSDGYNALTDRLDPNRRVFRSIPYGSSVRGLLISSVVDDLSHGIFNVPVGTPFEFGFEATVFNRNLDTSASLHWSFSLPEGYTMTSARGLSVNLPAVPEPAHWMLMLGGLAALAGWRRVRGRAC